MTDFEEIMQIVRDVDSKIHEFNPQAEIIANSKDPNLKADPAVTRPIIERLKPSVTELESKVKSFLINLR